MGRIHLSSLIVLSASFAALAESNSPNEFSQARAVANVRRLAALKSRTAGTIGEFKAIQYVRERLRPTGLDVRTEPFVFSCYDLRRARLRVGNVSVNLASIVFDPYRGFKDIRGDVVFVTAQEVNGEKGVAGLDFSRRVVVTTSGAWDYRIAARRPEAIVFVSDQDFEKLKGTRSRVAELLVRGKIRTLRSANLVAAAKNGKADRQIVLSAHIDSAGTPGAQDNASGVAVLLELARSLPKLDLPFQFRFVFFGAEEVGLLGSKAYLGRHRDDLQRCELVFNMDSVGGKDIWIDMRGGVRNVSSAKGVSRLPEEYLDKATHDFTGRWRLLDPATTSLDASNVPPWLQTAILDSVHELGYHINQGQGAGSDHRTFSEAGIVATNIAIGGIKSHSPDDLPGQISPVSLERAARIVTGVITRCVATFRAPPAQ